jgi:hypothetical protein
MEIARAQSAEMGSRKVEGSQMDDADQEKLFGTPSPSSKNESMEGLKQNKSSIICGIGNPACGEVERQLAITKKTTEGERHRNYKSGQGHHIQTERERERERERGGGGTIFSGQGRWARSMGQNSQKTNRQKYKWQLATLAASGQLEKTKSVFSSRRDDVNC